MDARRTTLFFLVWLYSIAHFVFTGIRQSLALFTGDFLAAFPSHRVAALVGRLDMHTGSLAEKWEWGPPPVWHYGPVLHLITLPLFAFATLREAFTFWLFVNLAFAAATLWIIVQLLDEGHPTFLTTSLVLFVTLNFNPFYEALSMRAIEIFEMLLVVAAYAFYIRGRSAAAGIAIGLAVMTKFLPLIYIPYFVLRRNWRALAASIATIVPIAAGTELLLGWRQSGIVQQLTAKGGSIFASDTNQSLSGAVLRVIAWSGWRAEGVFVSRVAILIAAAAVSLLFLRARRADGIVDLEWWALAIAMVLLPPHNQNYYLLFLLPPYLFLFTKYRKAALLRSARAVVLYVSFVIVALPVPLSPLSRLMGRPIWPLYLQSGLPFAGAAVLAGLYALEIMRATKRQETAPAPVAREEYAS